MKKEDFEMEIRKEYRDLQRRIIRRIEESKGELERIVASRILLRVSREEHYRLVAELVYPRSLEEDMFDTLQRVSDCLELSEVREKERFLEELKNVIVEYED